MEVSNLPKHVGVIVDGNRRWAKNKSLNPLYGHEVGIKKTLPKIIDYAFSLEIKEISVWIFSTENWDRSLEEIQHLMQLFLAFTDELIRVSFDNKIQVHHVGRKDRLPKELIRNLETLENNTECFNKRLNLCIDYGGKDEISRSVTKLVSDGIKPKEISVELINSFVRSCNNFINPPDLIIRTGGEQRTSGFMTWDSAYAELAFEKTYFPDFTPALLKKWIIN